MDPKIDIIAKFPGITILHQKIPGQEVGRHIHDDHEFFLPLQGELTVKYGNKAIKAGPGRMLYIPPDLDHSFSSSASGSGERVIWLIEKQTMNLHSNDSFSPSVFPANSLVKELIFYLLIHQKVEGQKYFISALI